MAGFELILTSDTINEGRLKINSAFTESIGIWTGGTGTDSILANNITGNESGGDRALSFGFGNIADGTDAIAAGTSSSALTDNSIAISSNSIVRDSISVPGATNGLSIGGANNTLEGITYGSIIGGVGNVLSGTSGSLDFASTIIGSIDSVMTSNASRSSIIAGGRLISVTLENSSMSVGTGQGTAAIGGFLNKSVAGDYKVMIGGQQNICGGSRSISIGGLSNIVGFLSTPVDGVDFASTFDGLIIGGSSNATINGCVIHSSSADVNGDSVVLGSSGSDIDGSRCSIIGGTSNIIDAGSDITVYNSILGGADNQIAPGNSTTTRAAIIAGRFNLMNAGGASYSVILGGYRNETGPADQSSAIIGSTGTITKGAFQVSMGHGGATPVSALASNNKIRFDIPLGDIHYNGTLFPGTADFAEYFEWLDGNPSNEDRVGYFVSLSGENIYIGNSNIIGAVSATPAIIGDTHGNSWKDCFLKDDFGRNITKRYSAYTLSEIVDNVEQVFIDDENNTYCITPWLDDMLGTLYTGDTSNKTFDKITNIDIPNPQFDKSLDLSYLSRIERKEWSPIGLVGKLHVRTSEDITGSTVSVNSSGMTQNGAGYHVLKEVKAYDGEYGIVQILLK